MTEWYSALLLKHFFTEAFLWSKESSLSDFIVLRFDFLATASNTFCLKECFSDFIFSKSLLESERSDSHV